MSNVALQKNGVAVEVDYTPFVQNVPCGRVLSESFLIVTIAAGRRRPMDNGHQAVIFLVEEDEDTRILLKMNLERDGYRVLLALDEGDARDRVAGGGGGARPVPRPPPRGAP